MSGQYRHVVINSTTIKLASESSKLSESSSGDGEIATVGMASLAMTTLFVA